MSNLYHPDPLVTEGRMVHRISMSENLSHYFRKEDLRGWDLRTLGPNHQDFRRNKPWRALCQLPASVAEAQSDFEPLQTHEIKAYGHVKRFCSISTMKFGVTEDGRTSPTIRLSISPLAMNAARIEKRDKLILTPTTSGLFVTRYPVGYAITSSTHSKQAVPNFYTNTCELAANLTLSEQSPARYNWDLVQDGQIVIRVHKDILYLFFGAVLK